MGAAGVGFSTFAVVQIEDRDLLRCVKCGRHIGTGVNKHHRKLRSRGGKGNVANGILLCGSGTTGCHGWAHANVKEATRLGLIVASWDDEREVPVKTWRGWMLLDDEGDWSPATEPDVGAPGLPEVQEGDDSPEGGSGP